MTSPAPAMSPAQLEAFVDASAAALGLALQPAHRPGVVRYVALAAGLAALLDDVALAPQAEPAVQFAPVPPAPGGGT